MQWPLRQEKNNFATWANAMRKTISLSNSDCTFTARKRNALCAKNHLFVKKLKSGLERSKVIWVASTRKRSNLHIGKPFGIAGGGSFQQSTRI
jgi:hypothetical protein